MSEIDPFEDPPRVKTPEDSETLHVDVDGFEGPLDLLLALARTQKIDLTHIAILPLAEQYLAFVENAKALRIELAADLLVMAAWLTYLKSRLIAPQEEDEEEDARDIAEDLAWRLRRLEAMREAADALFARTRLGVHLFPRGAPEAPVIHRSATWKASLYDLLAAYGDVRQQEIVRDMTMEKRPVFSLVDAREIMERVVGRNADWLPLEVIVRSMPSGHDRRALLASTFGATLEMAREGAISVRQSGPFAPLYVRGASGTAGEGAGENGAGEKSDG